MAQCIEYKCGCITHPLAGTIRKCSGLPSFTLSGKPVKGSLEGGDSRHTAALADKPKATYEVASIMP